MRNPVQDAVAKFVMFCAAGAVAKHVYGWDDRTLTNHPLFSRGREYIPVNMEIDPETGELKDKPAADWIALKSFFTTLFSKPQGWLGKYITGEKSIFEPREDPKPRSMDPTGGGVHFRPFGP